MEQTTTSSQGNQTPRSMNNVISTAENPISAFHDLLAELGQNPDQAATWPPSQRLGLPAFKGFAPNPELEKYYARKTKATAYIQQYGKKPTISPATEAEYRKKAITIDKWRPEPNDPPDIEAHVSTPGSFYAYRAALIWDAIQRLKEARRQLDRAPYETPRWKAAHLKLRVALMDLDYYQMDRKGERVQAYHQQQTLHDAGLSNAPEVSAFTRAKKLGQTKAPSPDKGKAWYAGNLNHEKPDWREIIFSRLEEIDSPWRLHAIVASLTGCRPQELEGIRISLEPDGRLRFEINGAKVSDQKGQPVRTLIVLEDSKEFETLAQHCINHGGDDLSFTLKAHASLANTAEAFGAAVKRAGNFALGKEFHFSAYCYRHALASDLKAGGVGREDLAVVLGHAVTETASCYGRYSGGRKNVRQIEAHGTRVVKVNHKADPTLMRIPQAQAPAASGSGTDGAVPGSVSEFPIEPSTSSPK